MPNVRSVTPVDAYVGEKIRGYRNKHNISQDRLGKLLGITYQQIQKYEEGKSRIVGSRLQQIATIFECEVKDLLPPPVRKGGRRKVILMSYIDRFIAMRDGCKLANSFVAIKNEALRMAIVDLARKFEAEGL